MFSLNFRALTGLTMLLLDKQPYEITIPATGARIRVLEEKVEHGIHWAILADVDAADRTPDDPRFMEAGPQWVVVDAGIWGDDHERV